MKVLLPLIVVILGIVPIWGQKSFRYQDRTKSQTKAASTPNQVQSFERAMNERVAGAGQLSLDGVLGLDGKLTDAILQGVNVDIEDVRKNTSLELLVNGVVLDKATLRPGQRGTIPLTPPFRILKNSRMDIDLGIDGDVRLKNVVANLEPFGRSAELAATPKDPQTSLVTPIGPPPNTVAPGPVHPAAVAPTPVPAPAPVLAQRDVVSAATHWGTRSRTKYLETVRGAKSQGDGAVDGWDFPDRGCSVDGRTAIFRGGDTALAVHGLDILRTNFTRLDALPVEIVGEGDVQVAFCPKPFAPTNVKTVRLRRGVPVTVDFGAVNVDRKNLQQVEVALNGGNGLQIDGVTFKAKVTGR